MSCESVYKIKSSDCKIRSSLFGLSFYYFQNKVWLATNKKKPSWLAQATFLEGRPRAGRGAPPSPPWFRRPSPSPPLAAVHSLQATPPEEFCSARSAEVEPGVLGWNGTTAPSGMRFENL
jgi:hypothetical protein